MINPIYSISRRLISYTKEIWNYFRAVYYTLRYVDHHSQFPAIKFVGNFPIKIIKGQGAKLNINGALIFQQWMNGNERTSIEIRSNGELSILNDFSLGDNIRISIDSNAKLIIKGAVNASSGITAKSIIMVKEAVEIGSDTIIAWDTFISDCDWHQYGTKHPIKKVRIGNHVWIGVGVNILKGATVNDDSIVTSKSVVLQGDYAAKTMISGNPAKVIKSQIEDWEVNMKL